MSDIQLGTVGEWSGFLAFAATLYLIWRERHDRLDVEQRRALLEARQLHASVGGTIGDRVISMRVMNASPLLPFQGVYMTVREAQLGDVGELTAQVVHPGASVVENVVVNGFAEIPEPSFTFDLLYTDSDGRRWVTDQNAQLRPYRSRWIEDQVDEARRWRRIKRWWRTLRKR